MNTSLFMALIDRYNLKAFTHMYIWGFEYKGNIYMAITDKSMLPFVCKLDMASRGAGYALRFCPTAEQKIFLLSKGAEVICSSEYFKTEVASSIYNNGEIFEKLVTEKFGQVWEKDNLPYTEGGDIEIDGVAYQIKFQKATFTNEKSLARMMNM